MANKNETIKATVSIRAESMYALTNALESIAERATMQIVAGAAVSTSISIEGDDAEDVQEALGAIAWAIEICEGAECKINAPGTVWHGRRLDPTPMERLINSAVRE